VEYEDEIGDGVETGFEIESVGGCDAFEAGSNRSCAEFAEVAPFVMDEAALGACADAGPVI